MKGRIQESTRVYEPRLVDPALMTFSEYRRRDGGSVKHPDSAYDVSIENINFNNSDKRQQFPKRLFTRRINGLDIEFRSHTHDRADDSMYRRTPDGEYLRINNQLVPWNRDEKIQLLGDQRYELSFAAYHGDIMVGRAQDEWGCVLVKVAREYKGFGIGLHLAKLYLEQYPNKPSGGFTSNGFRAFQKVWCSWVKDYLASGIYSQLVRDGVLSKQTVQNILDEYRNLCGEKPTSHKQNKKPSDIKNLDTNNPRDWLVYTDQHTTIIIYDRKFSEISQLGYDNHYWVEKVIKGLLFLEQPQYKDWVWIKTLGYDDIRVGRLLMDFMWGLSAARDGVFLEPHEIPLLTGSVEQQDPPDGLSGVIAHAPRNPQLAAFSSKERAWRKKHDQYDEIYHHMLEIAFSKYQQ